MPDNGVGWIVLDTFLFLRLIALGLMTERFLHEGLMKSQINRQLVAYHSEIAMGGFVRENCESYPPGYPAKAGVHSSRE